MLQERPLGTSAIDSTKVYYILKSNIKAYCQWNLSVIIFRSLFSPYLPTEGKQQTTPPPPAQKKVQKGVLPTVLYIILQSRQAIIPALCVHFPGGKEKRAENHLFSSSTQSLSLSPTKNCICIWCFQVNQLFSATVEQGYVHYKVVGNIKKWPTLFSILERLGSSSQLG